MPYILSPIIKSDASGLWGEGAPYEKKNIYNMSEDGPPVNYDAHTLKVHSLTHCETSAHTNADGARLESFFSGAKTRHFFGAARVVRLQGDKWGEDKHWEVSLDDLKEAGLESVPEKLLLTADSAPVLDTGFHDPAYALTLSQEAADWLVSAPHFNVYGTSWKSTDYQPNSRARPIHNTLFKQAVIFEMLALGPVPAGEYFFAGFPIPLEGASEAPVCPVLFERDEINS